MQQNRIDYSEDDNVCPNAQHQSDQSYERERGRLPKHAQRVTNIQQQILHRINPALDFCLVMRAPRCSKLRASAQSITQSFFSLRCAG